MRTGGKSRAAGEPKIPRRPDPTRIRCMRVTFVGGWVAGRGARTLCDRGTGGECRIKVQRSASSTGEAKRAYMACTQHEVGAPRFASFCVVVDLLWPWRKAETIHQCVAGVQHGWCRACLHLGGPWGSGCRENARPADGCFGRDRSSCSEPRGLGCIWSDRSEP